MTTAKKYTLELLGLVLLCIAIFSLVGETAASTNATTPPVARYQIAGAGNTIYMVDQLTGTLYMMASTRPYHGVWAICVKDPPKDAK